MKSNRNSEKISRINRKVSDDKNQRISPASHSKAINKSGKGKRITQSGSAEYRTEKLRAVERRKARSRSVSMIFFTMIIMLLTVVLIINVMNRASPKPRFMFIPEGSIEYNIDSTALIIRDEAVINAPVSGVVRAVVSEGTRVSHGETIALILDEKSQEALLSLRNARQQIAQLQIELMNQGKGAGAKVIYDESDREISRVIDLLRRDAMQKRTMNIDSYRTSVNVIMDRRDVRLSGVEFNDTRLNELKNQKKALESQLGIVSGTLTARTPGMVSYHIDGLEQVLTPDTISDITIRNFLDYTDDYMWKHSSGIRVERNEPVVRITRGIYQYIIIKIPSEYKDKFDIDSFHNIKAPYMGTEIRSCRVVAHILEGDDLAVVLRADRQLERFSDVRTFNAVIAVSRTSGMRVPFSSLEDFSKTDNTAYIYIVEDGFIRKSFVDIVDYNREYAIIESREGQEHIPSINGYLVKNPESVREGESIGGAR